MAVLMGGNQDSATRKSIWQSDVTRIIFATPQAIESHIEQSIVPLKRIVYVCVDECHKAQKTYSYVGIISRLALSGHEFRVVGLSATPGSDLRAIKSVTSHLKIQRIELRDESDTELQPYLQKRHVEKIVVQPSTTTSDIESALNESVRPMLHTLTAMQIGFSHADPARTSPWLLQSAINSLQSGNGSLHASPNMLADALGMFNCVRKVLNAREALRASVRQCYEYLENQVIGDARGLIVDPKHAGQRKAPTKAINLIRESIAFKKAIDLLKANLAAVQEDLAEETPVLSSTSGSVRPPPAASLVLRDTEFQRKLSIVSAHHPKVGALVRLITEHFSKVEQKLNWMANEEEEHGESDGDGDGDASGEDDEDMPLKHSKGETFKFRGCATQSNVIVFADSRASVDEIIGNLQPFKYICGIRPAKFIGQAKNGAQQRAHAHGHTEREW